MTAAILSLAAERKVTEQDVLAAFYTHRALLLEEVRNPDLANDEAHQLAADAAKAKYLRLYDAWIRQ
jgi:hypothetical protein